MNECTTMKQPLSQCSENPCLQWEDIRINKMRRCKRNKRLWFHWLLTQNSAHIMTSNTSHECQLDAGFLLLLISSTFGSPFSARQNGMQTPRTYDCLCLISLSSSLEQLCNDDILRHGPAPWNLFRASNLELATRTVRVTTNTLVYLLSSFQSCLLLDFSIKLRGELVSKRDCYAQVPPLIERVPE